MSDAHGPHGHGVRSEEDRISTGKILFVGIASLVIFFLASAGAVAWLRVRQGERPPLPIPPETAGSKVGMVERQMFDQAFRGERDRIVRAERLRTFGWVDRRAGVVHMPIDHAMELVAKGVRPAPVPGPQQHEHRHGGQP